MRALDPRLLRRTKSARPLLTLDCGLGIGTALAVLLGATMLARIGARAFHGTRLDQLWPDLALLVFAFAVRGAFAWGMEVAGRRAAWSVLSELRLALAEKRLRTQPAAIDGTDGAEITAVSVQGVEALEGYFARYLPQIVLASIVPFLVIAWVAVLDLEAAVIMVLTLPLVPVFMWLIGTYTADRTQERWQALRALSSHFLDVVRGLPTLRAFGRAGDEAAIVAEVSDRYRRATMETLRISFLSGSVLELAATIGVALVAVTAGVRLVERQPRPRGRTRGDRARTRAVSAFPAARRRVPRERRRAGRGGPAVRAARCSGVGGARRHTARAQPRAGVGDVRARVVLVPVPLRHGARRVQPRALARRGGGAGRRERRRQEHGGARWRSACCRPRAAGSPLAASTCPSAELDAWRRLVAWVPQHPTLFRGTVADNIRLGDPEARRGGGGRRRAARRRGRVHPVTAGRLRDGRRRRRAVAVAGRAPPDRARPSVRARRPARDPRRADRGSGSGQRGDRVGGGRAPAARTDDAADRAPVRARPQCRSRRSARRRGRGADGTEAGGVTATLRALVRLVPVSRRRLAGAAVLGALTVLFGVGLMATSGYLISRAAERPEILSLMVTIVAVQFFGVGRPVLRYLERLASHDIALRTLGRLRARFYARIEPLAPAELESYRAGRPAVADGRRCGRAPEPVPARPRAAAGRAPRGRRLGRCRRRLPPRCRARARRGTASSAALAVPALAGLLGAPGRSTSGGRSRRAVGRARRATPGGARARRVRRRAGGGRPRPRCRPDAGATGPPRRARRGRRRRSRARRHRRDRRRRARRRGERVRVGRARSRADRAAGAARAGLVRGGDAAGRRRPRAVGDARRGPAGARAHRPRSRSFATRSDPRRSRRGRSRSRSRTYARATPVSRGARSTGSRSGSSRGSGSRCSDRAAPARPLSPTCCCGSSIPSAGASRSPVAICASTDRRTCGARSRSPARTRTCSRPRSATTFGSRDRTRATPRCRTRSAARGSGIGSPGSRTASTRSSARPGASSPEANASASSWRARCSPDAPVLVLDEPTAHLDPKTAHELIEDVFSAAGGSHRAADHAPDRGTRPGRPGGDAMSAVVRATRVATPREARQRSATAWCSRSSSSRSCSRCWPRTPTGRARSPSRWSVARSRWRSPPRGLAPRYAASAVRRRWCCVRGGRRHSLGALSDAVRAFLVGTLWSRDPGRARRRAACD